MKKLTSEQCKARGNLIIECIGFLQILEHDDPFLDEDEQRDWLIEKMEREVQYWYKKARENE